MFQGEPDICECVSVCLREGRGVDSKTKMPQICHYLSLETGNKCIGFEPGRGKERKYLRVFVCFCF